MIPANVATRIPFLLWGEPGADGGGRVLGRSGLRLPAPHAAFVNAFQIHSQEFDCVHEPAVVHPLATIASALLAEADRSGPYDGERLLTALVAGCHRPPAQCIARQD